MLCKLSRKIGVYTSGLCELNAANVTFIQRNLEYSMFNKMFKNSNGKIHDDLIIST